MAGLVSAGNLSHPDDFNYSVSHRPVPLPVPLPPAPSTPTPVAPDSSSTAAADRVSLTSEGRRRRSFSFSRKQSRHRRHHSDQDHPPPLPLPGPGPLPTTRRAPQARVEPASAPAPAPTTDHTITTTTTTTTTSHQHLPPRPPPSRPPPSHPPPPAPRAVRSESTKLLRKTHPPGAFTMLRKSSRMRREEQERLTREHAAAAAANALPTQPPQLQSIRPLPNLGGFGGDDANRSDSYAIFNRDPSPHDAPPRHPHAVPRAPANFSRPVANMAHYASPHPSSSPAYAVRSGNAFAQAASASPSRAGAAGSINGEDGHERTESMTHRGRYSYASSTAPVNVNSPRRVRRRKDPTPFNILVIGAKNSGKTSFISFLRHSLARPTHTRPYTTDPAGDAHVPAARSSFTSHYLESEMDGERIGVTLWDSAGLEKHVIDLQLREMATFVEAKFEETFVEEQKVVRSPGFRDTHIHCAFLVLDPVRLDATTAASKTAAGLPQGGLDDELDLQVLRSLWGKTTVIPVIAKADTLTTGHMSFLKRAVWESLKSAKLDPLEALELEGEDEPDSDTLPEGDEGGDEQHPRGVNHIAGSRDDSDDSDDDDDDDDDSASDAPVPRSKRSNGHHRQPSLAGTVASVTGEELPYLPMSILSPDLYDLPPYTTTAKDARVGRSFPWGFADPYDPEHCDFTRLRDSIFSEWRGDLRDLSRTKWYENWRTSRLKNLPGSKQRVRGGVTPVAVVPREGRTVSPTTTTTMRREPSLMSASHHHPATMSIPRSTSSSTAVASPTSGPIGLAVGSPTTPKAPERPMGLGSDAGSVSSRGGAAMHAQ